MPLDSLHDSVSTKPKRILAVKLADLGDLLTITPALQALRAAYPTARIDVLVPPQSAKLLAGSPYISNVLTFDKFPFDRKRGLLNASRLMQTANFILQLRLAGYDTVLLFHHFATRWGAFKFAAVSYATGAPVRVGLDNGRGFFLNLRAQDGGFGAMHEVEYWLLLAGLAGADNTRTWRPYIHLTRETHETASSLMQEMGIKRARPVVALHPGAGWYSRARIWPIRGFAAVARGLIESHNAQVVILGGPDEGEAAAELERIVGPDNIFSVVGRTDILVSAALIQQCDLFVGNDSGPMHIAAAVNTPVVAVFGPSNIEAWGPYTPPGEHSRHTVVSRDLPCMPCFYRGNTLGLREGCGTRECLTLLDARPVLAACRLALDNTRTLSQMEVTTV